MLVRIECGRCGDDAAFHADPSELDEDDPRVPEEEGEWSGWLWLAAMEAWLCADCIAEVMDDESDDDDQEDDEDDGGEGCFEDWNDF